MIPWFLVALESKRRAPRGFIYWARLCNHFLFRQFNQGTTQHDLVAHDYVQAPAMERLTQLGPIPFYRTNLPALQVGRLYCYVQYHTRRGELHFRIFLLFNSQQQSPRRVNDHGYKKEELYHTMISCVLRAKYIFRARIHQIRDSDIQIQFHFSVLRAK